MKVYVRAPYPENRLAELKELFEEVVYEPWTETGERYYEDEMLAHLLKEQPDVLITELDRVTEKVLAGYKGLKAIGDCRATPANLDIAACTKANISEFVEKQEKGLDAMVGNRGLKLSGGEKQRLSIARVLLKDPALLIFDEATSALDSISEAKIQEAIEPIIQERTSILIAHRLSTILAADEILVVKDGRIVERGQHQELVKRGGVYTELYETQFKKALEAAE